MNQQSTNNTQDASLVCPKCDSLHILRITGEDEATIHYGRLVCGDCGQFIDWLRDPDVSIAHINRKQAIDSMLATASLNEWERSFLKNIYEERTLSPKQSNVYQRIYQKNYP